MEAQRLRKGGNLKALVFVAMMGALGNGLFVVSQTIFAWGQVALDLSHVGTLMAAIYGGPLMGLLTGVLVGIGPGIYFGYLTPTGGLGFLGFLALPIGKAIAGVTTGALAKGFGIDKRRGASLIAILAVVLGYVPECIFTIFFFWSLEMTGLLVFILPKAWLEMVFMGFYMGALVGNTGFSNFAKQYFPTKPKTFSEKK